jgi:hypothetical protein
MNWLKTLWNKLVSKTSVAPTLVVVEEVQEPEQDIADLFLEVCADLGIGSKIIEQTGAVELFISWYDGDATKVEVQNSLATFISETGGQVNAKLSRFVK